MDNLGLHDFELYFTNGELHCFLVPVSLELAAGDATLQDTLGQTHHLDLEDLARWKIPTEIATRWAQARRSQIERDLDEHQELRQAKKEHEEQLWEALGYQFSKGIQERWPELADGLDEKAILARAREMGVDLDRLRTDPDEAGEALKSFATRAAKALDQGKLETLPAVLGESLEEIGQGQVVELAQKAMEEFNRQTDADERTEFEEQLGQVVREIAQLHELELEQEERLQGPEQAQERLQEPEQEQELLEQVERLPQEPGRPALA